MVGFCCDCKVPLVDGDALSDFCIQEGHAVTLGCISYSSGESSVERMIACRMGNYSLDSVHEFGHGAGGKTACPTCGKQAFFRACSDVGMIQVECERCGFVPVI